MIKLNGVEIKLDKYPDGTFLFKDIPPIGGWCRDGYDSFVYDGALKTVFKDGEMCYVETFKKIRNRLNGGN